MVVATPTDVQIAAVAGNQVTLTADAAVPQVGQFIASTSGDGFLRQVTSVSTVSGQTVVQTQPASLNQVVSNVEISSAFVLTSVPTEVAPTQAGVAVKPSSGQKGATEWQWPQTGFRLSSAPVKRNTGNAQRSLQLGVTSAGSGNMDVSTQTVSKVGNWATFTGPDTVGILTGTSGVVDLKLDVTKDDTAWGGAPLPTAICKVEIIDDGGVPGLIALGSMVPTATQIVDGYTATRNATQGLSVNAAGVAARAKPYMVVLRAYIDESGNHCQGSWRFFLGWKERLDIAIRVAVVSTPDFPQSESKPLDFTGSFNVHNDVTFTFDPRLEADVILNGASLNYARLEAKARAELAQKLTVTATGAGTLDQTKTLISPRKFVKVYMAGTVPIVMSGEFTADLRVQGNVTGALTATEEVKFRLEDMTYGVIYENGVWRATQNVSPTYELKLSGNGDAEAHLTLSLVPKLSIKFYEAATGRLIVSPYLQADAGIHGQVLADITPAGITTDADYWLTQGQISGGVDAYLMADVSILDHTFVKWPSAANIADYGTFKKLTLLANTPIAGLPSLTATYDASAIHPTDSRAFLIRGRAVDVANPFGGSAILKFANWTAPKVIALNNAGYTFVPSPAGSDPGDVWIAFTSPGTYTVRLGGNSSMGGWARQVAEVVVAVTDGNNNGIIDQWEIKYSLLGTGSAIAAADTDTDGLTNLQEFQQGLNPKVRDSNLPTPTYSVINCGTPVAGQLMTCTVSGTNLPIDLALTATGCANIQTVAATASTTRRQFTCTPASPSSLQISLSSAAVGAGANYAQSITISQPTCTLPQVLTNGVCVDPPPAATSRLNDTGITASQCYQAGSDTLVACSSAGAIALNNAQDGMTGRDVTTSSGTDGKLGFSFASVPAAGSDPGGCVLDNFTGLMWEVKTTDGGLRDWNKTYTKYGDNRAGDANAYVAAVNAINLCGHNDWRLPSADELQNIVDYGVAYPGPTIDASWFPNTQDSGFWSASPFVDFPDYWWGVNFSYGVVSAYERVNAVYVRLVRAGQSQTPPRYIVSADGQEVTDSQTKLIWRRCAEGMVYSGETCTGAARGFTHEAALQRAAAQASSTGITWRLPNIKELSSIADSSRRNPAIDPTAFPATPLHWFWSASPYVGNSGSAWGVYSATGAAGNYGHNYRNDINYVRLVRAGQ